MFEQFLGQVVNLVGCVELPDIGQNIQALLGSDRVAIAALIDHELRYEQIEVLTVVVPPIMGEMLVCRRDQITTRARRKITDDAGFEVDGETHRFRPLFAATLCCLTNCDLSGFMDEDG